MSSRNQGDHITWAITTKARIVMVSNTIPASNIIQAQKRTFPVARKGCAVLLCIIRLMSDFSLMRDGSRITRNAEKVIQSPRADVITNVIKACDRIVSVLLEVFIVHLPLKLARGINLIIWKDTQGVIAVDDLLCPIVPQQSIVVGLAAAAWRVPSTGKAADGIDILGPRRMLQSISLSPL